MINIFEEAFKANASLSAKTINESVAKENWTDAYKTFTDIVDSCDICDEAEIEAKVTAEYAKHKGESDWDEAFKRWNDRDCNESKSVSLDKLRFTEDIDSFQPEDNVMVVYNPDLSNDMTDEEAEAAAEDLIGKDICKCGVCGANYVCSCEASAEDALITDEDDVAEDSATADADSIEEDGDDDLSESILFRDFTEDIDADNNESEDTDTKDADNCDCFNECPVCGAKENQAVIGKISPMDDTITDEPEIAKEPAEAENDTPIEDTEDTEDSDSTEDDEDNTLMVDESTLNRVFTSFAKENYSDVKGVKFNSGRLIGNQLSLEGFVFTANHKKSSIKLVSEGFNLSDATKSIKMFEKGPFTESAVTAKNKVPFVLECEIKGNNISFTGMKYNYTIKSVNESYKVYGHTHSVNIK